MSQGETNRLACALASQAHASVEKNLEAWKKAALDQTACHAGCAYCCYLEVSVTAAELMLIVSTLESKGLILETINRLDEYKKAGSSRCALLGEDDCCVVYGQRPVVCRTWFSADEDDCRREHEGERVPGRSYPQYSMDVREVILKQLKEHHSRIGLVGDMMSLRQALTVILPSSQKA